MWPEQEGEPPADAIARLRREAIVERGRLARRQGDRARLAELENKALAADEAARPAIERLAETLRRRLEEAVLVDGSDADLQARGQRVEVALAEQSRALDAQRARARGAGARSKEVDPAQARQRQRALERLDADLDAMQDMLSTLDGQLRAVGAGSPPAVDRGPAAAAGDIEARGARLQRLAQDAQATQASLARTLRLLQIRQAAGAQALRHLNDTTPAGADAEFDALGRHLRQDLERFVAQADRLWAREWAAIVERADRLVVSRFRAVDATADLDPDYETLSMRRTDLMQLEAFLRLETGPLFESVSRALPQRSRQAMSGARGVFPHAMSAVLPPCLADLSMREDLWTTPLPASSSRALALQAGTWQNMPALGRVEVTPRTRWRRGDRFAAAGRFMKEVSRVPQVLLGPLMGLTFIGVNVMQSLKKQAGRGDDTGFVIGCTVLGLSAVYAVYKLTSRSRLNEQVQLERGKSQLRDALRKRGDEVAQAWRRQLQEHGERCIQRTLALVREPCAALLEAQSGKAARQRERLEAQARETGEALRGLQAAAAALRKLRTRQWPEAQSALVNLGAAAVTADEAALPDRQSASSS